MALTTGPPDEEEGGWDVKLTLNIIAGLKLRMIVAIHLLTVLSSRLAYSRHHFMSFTP